MVKEKRKGGRALERETFVNKYVIKVEHGHPGNTTYKIISTTSGFREMVRVLGTKIDGIEKRSQKDPQFQISRQTLWNDYATLFPGRTSRIWVSLELDSDLGQYHERPSLARRFVASIGSLVVVAILMLALIGIVTVIRFLM